MKPLCKRCGNPFTPVPSVFKTMTTCCDTCQVRNILDGLGLPMPPELLDKYTRKPSLSEQDFYKQLKK